MRRRRISVLLSALLLALAAAAGTATPASAAVPQGFVGMVLGDPIYPSTDSGLIGRQLSTMVASGVESLRVVFNWSDAQPYGSWSQVPLDQAKQFTDVAGIPTRFAQLDQIVAAAAQRRLRLLPTIVYAPSWDTAPHPAGTYGIPAQTAPYANFVVGLVHRYGPGGSFWATHSPKLPIRAWQIWNEPNIIVFWPQQPFAASYVALLRAAHDAIKRADPGAKVVLAGLPNYSWTDLRSIYRVHGASRLFDVVALHPYTRRPRGVITILSRVRRVMNRFGDRHKPILADEISWPSSLGKTTLTDGFDFATTRRGQAQRLRTMLPMLAANRRRLGLLGFYYYTWAGTDTRGGRAFEFAGLFHFGNGSFSAKPAYYAFRSAALALEHCKRKGATATVCLRRG